MLFLNAGGCDGKPHSPELLLLKKLTLKYYEYKAEGLVRGDQGFAVDTNIVNQAGEERCGRQILRSAEV